jgi:hypothetical protein
MYNQREALAYSGKLPEQQKAGITPQLLDLLAIQKVDADKTAAAQKLALAAGQPQPTVADLLKQKAMQSARQEIMQKMGLAGLQQQQPPQGPLPQQMEEPQGLPGASSNLPESYRQGGIIAFAEGGTDDGPQFTPEQQARIDSNWEAMARLRDQDPEALAQKSQAEYQSQVGADRLAAIQAKREREKGLQALFDRQASERPSNFTRGLELMGKNLHGVGGLGSAMAGVSEGVNATNAGYTTQDIGNYKTLSDLDDQIQAAIDANNVGAYNALTARRKEVEAQMKTGLESGTQMSDILERTMAGRQRSFEATKQREAASILANQTRADAATQRAQEANFRTMGLQNEMEARRDLKESQLKQAAELARENMSRQENQAAVNAATKETGFAFMTPEEQDAVVQRYLTRYASARAAKNGPSLQEQALEILKSRAPNLKTQGGAR